MSRAEGSRRYQVFVSSTYEDLKDERREVIQALLELDCFPAWMELFNAANSDQWEVIKQVIDESDFYVVIVAGRYGSLTDEGISFTEKEYRYALGIGKPILGFIHENIGNLPNDQCESDSVRKKKLQKFHSLVKQKLIAKWKDPSDLGGKVSRSLSRLFRSSKAVGWVRADSLEAASATKVLIPEDEKNELKNDMEGRALGVKLGSEDLAQGDELIEVSFFTYLRKVPEHQDLADIMRGFNVGVARFDHELRKVKISWNMLFLTISDNLYKGARMDLLHQDINKAICQHFSFKHRSEIPKGYDVANVSIVEPSVKSIIRQFLFLDLIELAPKVNTDQGKEKVVENTREEFWILTPKGMNHLRGISAFKRRAENR